MINKIRIQNFRNLPDKVFEFSPKVTVIVGPNASGKTNLLESIYLVSTGKSFKANLETDLIMKNKSFARVKGLIDDNQKLEIILSYESHKKLLVNGVPKRLIDFSGNLKVVLFGPWDMDLVTDSPSIRRKFLDAVLSQVDREYRRAIISYEKGLRLRNKLLFRIREENLSRSQLLFWNQLLIKNGDYISNSRQDFINFVNSNKSLMTNNYQLTYDKSVISVGRLDQYANEEIASATTLVGPHRDDFVFQESERNLANFGSRGEQRMSVLWLKLAELEFIENKTKIKPTLLLDDIFSELDEKHRKIVFDISHYQQTIITTADPNFIVDMDELKRIEF
jgi:DNA replication and repair protein RecF